ncbi:hypothetical protein MERGE_001854 [Pneumocystis wakefieldiae]|uniref:Major surface glycoprotein 2 C-terminal domain-containing protein n=2 Tax=Pneumocystis wakefieldiae TaxID=38082 RepID=A0A899FV64_9ASCO|nr:hypothetical protein MERGE_001854 [Pneumocystis wakefieldiae]
MFYPIIYKIVAIGVFNLVAFTYGDKNVDLSVRSSQVSTRDVSFEGFVIQEEDIYAFILKNDYEDDSKCEKRLEEYCKELKEMDPELEKVHTKIKEICGNNDKEKCKEIKEKIIKVIEQFNLGIFLNIKYPLFYEHCDKYLPKCFFFSGINSFNVTFDCNYLRYFCYSQEYKKLKGEIILRAIGNNISNYTDFRKKAKDVCPVLVQQNNNLIIDCLKIERLFLYFNYYASHFCSSLNNSLNDYELQEKCHEKLGKCYFIKNGCKKCDELEELCRKKNITYSPPKEDFSPIELEETLFKKIDLENFYKDARNKGLVFGELKETLDDMLIYLSVTYEGLKEAECRGVLKDNCDFFESLSLEFKKLCQDEKKEKCKDILEVTNRCKKLKKNLYITGFSTEFGDNKESKIIIWENLPTSLNEKECLELTSECYLMRVACNNFIIAACRNAILGCYKRRQDLLFIKLIESQLHKEKYELKSNDEKLKICQKIVMEKCVTLRNTNIRNFLKCLRPKEICDKVEEILLIQSRDLGQALDKVRDSPKEKDCVELKKDCDGIVGNLDSNNEKCATLKKNCEFLRVAEELKSVFLKEKSNALASLENCLKALKEKCDRLSKGEEHPLRISCVFKEETCKRIVSEVSSHCVAFKNNIEKHDIVNRSENGNKTLAEEICMLWVPYCDQLMENCADELKEGNGTVKRVCSQLKVNCKSIIDRLHLEDSLIHKLEGSLSTEEECEKALGKYCAQSKNTTSHIFDSLCKDESDPTKDSTTELCKKLVEEVRNKCPALKNGLEKSEKDLEKKKSRFEKVKQEAEESIKEAKSVLSKVKGEGQDASVSEAEAKAFDATAKALKLYLELKENCKGLQPDCSFTKKCPDSKAVCERIEKLCKGVEPLEVKYHYGEKVTEQCTQVRTTDTWVTSTSLHTTTMTTTPTVTSTLTLTTIRKCKPTRCTTDSSKETQEEEEEDVKPNEAVNIRASAMLKMMLLGAMMMGIL